MLVKVIPMPSSMVSWYQKPHFDNLDLRSAMIQLIVSLVSCDAETSGNMSLKLDSHASPHFEHLDLRNAMIPLMMLLASHDTNAGANGMT